MKQSIDNVEMLQLLEKKQKLLLGIKVAITLDRMDLVRKLAGELRIITEKERSLYNNSCSIFTIYPAFG